MKKVILEEHGYFWWHDVPIPEGHFGPESSITGVLKIDEEGRVELELHGTLPNELGAFSILARKPIDRSKAIQGILKGSGKRVLLSGLYPNHGQFRSNGISYEGFVATNCLIGDSPFPCGKEVAIRRLEIDLTGYEEWLGMGSITVNRTRSTIRATYKEPKDITYRLDTGRITIKYGCHGPYFGSHRKRDLSLSQNASLVYSPGKAVTLSEVKTQFGLFADLFILLTGSEYCIDWPLIAGGKDTYKFYFLKPRTSAKAPDWRECCTMFLELRNNFGELFSAWRRKRERIGAGVFLYFGTRRGLTQYAEDRFVNLVRGIESFHRKRHPQGTEAAKPKPTEQITRILDSIGNEADRAWLEKRLLPKASPALSTRIFETFRAVPIGLKEGLLRQFAIDCARIRNDLAHYGGQREGGNYGQFVIAVDKKGDALSYLYHALLLHEIGVSESIINRWLYDSYQSPVIKQSLFEVGLLNSDRARMTP